jgi:hypothetical protein
MTLFSTLNYFKDKSEKPYFGSIISFFLVVFSCVFSSCNPLDFFKAIDNEGAWETMLLKSNDLTNNLSHIEPYSWKAKKVFRLTVPLLMKIFFLTPSLIIKLQFILGYFFYFFSFKLLLRITKNSIIASLFTTTLSFLYIGKAAFFEFQYTWFDGFSFIFLLAAIYSRKPYLIFLFSSLAAWNDERAFVGLAFVFLFHFQQIKITNSTLSKFLKLNKNAFTVVFAVICYCVFRIYLSSKYNMSTPSEGANLGVLINQKLIYSLLGLITFFEGYYVLIILYFFYLLKFKEYFSFFINILPLITLSIIALCVTDISRSGAFSFPLLFIVIKYFTNVFSISKLTNILIWCLIISIFIPPIFICTDWDLAGMFPKIIPDNFINLFH